MITLNQETWNVLFGWLSNKKCLLPEGCNVPLEGLLFYLLAIILISIVVIEREKIVNGKENLSEKIRALLESFRNLE